jgi:hypothetical protein
MLDGAAGLKEAGHLCSVNASVQLYGAEQIGSPGSAVQQCR